MRRLLGHDRLGIVFRETPRRTGFDLPLGVRAQLFGEARKLLARVQCPPNEPRYRSASRAAMHPVPAAVTA